MISFIAVQTRLASLACRLQPGDVRHTQEEPLKTGQQGQAIVAHVPIIGHDHDLIEEGVNLWPETRQEFERGSIVPSQNQGPDLGSQITDTGL
jgi:hypothetical protein